MINNLIKDYPYKSTFAGNILPLKEEEKNFYVSKASLEKLQSIFPKTLNLRVNKDLIGICLNGAIAGMMNENYDAIDQSTGVEIGPNFLYKLVCLEHDHKKIMGCIVNYGFSEMGSNIIIPPEEAKLRSTPFNISLAIVLYKSILSKDFLEYLQETDEGGSKFGKLSGSWELFFKDYDIAVGPKEIKAAKLYSDEKVKDSLESILVSNGGSGKRDGEYVYRVIKGPFLIPGGIGLVENPAANVKGIYIIDPDYSVIEENTNTENLSMKHSEDHPEDKTHENKNHSDDSSMMMDDKEMEEMMAEMSPDVKEQMKKMDPEMRKKMLSDMKTMIKKKMSMATSGFITIYPGGKIENTSNIPTIVYMNSEDFQKNISQSNKINVINSELNNNKNNLSNMIKTITELNDENLKESTASNIQNLFKKGIEEANTQWLTEKNRIEKALQEAETKSQEAIAKQKELEEGNIKLTKELEGIKATIKSFEDEKLARQQVETFNIRMSKIEEKYNLNDKQRKIVAKNIEKLNDSDFDVYIGEMEELFSGVLKSIASNSGKTENVSEDVIDKVVTGADKVTKDIPNTTTAQTQTLKEKYAKAFSKENVLVK